MIGLSLSLCIADIIEGRVDAFDVEGIVSGTKASTLGEWQDIIDHYKPIYWWQDPQWAEELAWGFIDRGLVCQPREYGLEAVNIAAGHWTNDDGEIL